MRRRGFLAWRDLLLHLAALGVVAAGMARALDPGGSDPAVAVHHPSNCHACSKCPVGAVAARDLFLLRDGAIEAPEEGD